MPALAVPKEPACFERGDHLYLVAPVGRFAPTDEQIKEFAFAEEYKREAPNPALVWMRGQYVEADKPNLNRAMWTAGELALKALTPMFMPVTVMHDPRTAVGLIADTKLLTPEADQVPRAKIETALALWGHRFPEAVEEALANADQGTLMQSMECLSPDYACSDCGMNFHKLPHGYERENWCAHLKGEEGSNASRILGNVIFTGTGLIYGTRGAEGADPQAHLEVFQEEVASLHREAHERAGAENTRKPSRPRKAVMELEQAEYDKLKAAEARVTDLEAAKSAAETAVETAEAAKTKAEEERETEKKRADDAEEKARRSDLRDERMSKLGPGFTGKLGDFTKGRLQEQAGEMSDEDWDARLKEVEETAGVKRDAEAAKGKPPKDPDKPDAENEDDFGIEEIANAQFGGSRGPDDAVEPTRQERASVTQGLFSAPKAATPK